MKVMKLHLLAFTAIAIALSACAPSPYYSGNKNGLAPGSIPRDSRGRPVVDGQAIDYLLPKATPIVTTKGGEGSNDIAGPVAQNDENQIIYFDDLIYPGVKRTAPHQEYGNSL